jgi:hypothetical protein
MDLRITWRDAHGINRFHNIAKSLGTRMPVIGMRVVNFTGDRARTQVRRELPKQTGLKRKVIVKAVRVTRASTGRLAYVMDAKGGDIALKHFGPRETRAGVSAAPFGKRQVFAGTFTMGGRFPNRVPLGMGGHVFKREGASRFPIEKQKSGVIIPAEMVKGATAQAFERTVTTVMPRRIQHELARLMK